MKLTLAKSVAVGQRSGFTAVEALVVMATLVILCGSIIMCNLFGLSMATRQQIWLSSSDDAAQCIGKLMTDIRSGASNHIGSGNLSNSFVSCGSNVWQQGNTLIVYQGNTNGQTNGAWVMYYYDAPTSNLYRTNWTGSNSGNNNIELVSANLLMTNNAYNSNIFSGYAGTNGVWAPEIYQTNVVGTPLILVCLSFSKMQNPQIEIMPGSAVDFYQITTMIASRNRP